MLRLALAMIGLSITLDAVTYTLKANADDPTAVKIIGNLAMPIIAALLVLLINEVSTVAKGLFSDSDE